MIGNPDPKALQKWWAIQAKAAAEQAAKLEKRRARDLAARRRHREKRKAKAEQQAGTG